MVQHLEEGVPVVQQLHRQGVGLGMIMALVPFAGGAQVSQPGGIFRRQVGGWAFAGGVPRRHQSGEGVEHWAAEGPYFPRVALGQTPRLADQVREATQPAGVATLGQPAVAHQPAGEALQQILHPLFAPPGDVIQRDRGCSEHPQPQRLATFGPARFVGV